METIEIVVEGGTILSVCGIPKGVQVRVLDFDCDGCTGPNVKTNEEGENYWEALYESPKEV